MARWWAALAAAVALGATASASPQATIERTPEFVARVNAAIDRGVAWLRKTQSSTGAWPDYPMFEGATTALVYHTLRVSGVPRDDPAAKAAWAAAKRAYRQPSLTTYGAAVDLMAIAEHGERVANAADDRDVKLDKDDRKWAEEIVRSLVSGQDQDGTWTYEADGSGAPGRATLSTTRDHSNLQYALLGLKAAARCGIAIDPAVWRRTLQHLLAAQEASGPEAVRVAGPPRGPKTDAGTSAPVVDHARGWCYLGQAVTPPRGAAGGGNDAATRLPRASMTAGGVSSLVICRSELLGTREITPKLDTDSERAIWDGIAWLAANWNPPAILSPADDMPAREREAMSKGLFYYELYGVERAGVLAGVEWMGGRDWYGEGAEPILAHQLQDGSWQGLNIGPVVEDIPARANAYHVVNTCFSLLFLKRGTTPVRRGAVTQGGGGDDINFGAAARLAGRDLEDFLDLVLARWRRASDDEVKRRLFDGATSVGPRIVEPLLVRLESPDAQRRAEAHALLRHATGLDFGFDPAGSAAARDAATVRWQTWWMGAKDGLAYDPVTRRLAASR
jgi:hypothetical protein